MLIYEKILLETNGFTRAAVYAFEQKIPDLRYLDLISDYADLAGRSSLIIWNTSDNPITIKQPMRLYNRNAMLVNV